MSRVCVYTAIYGDYDELKPVPRQDIRCDYVCFTDNPALSNPGTWRLIHAPILPELHPRMRSRFFKVLNHRLFQDGRLTYGRKGFARLVAGPRYDFTIWLDGSIRVKNAAFAREFIAHVGASGWSMFVHPDRSDIFSEAEFSKTMRKYFDQPIDQQIEAYRAEKFRAEKSLLATGLIARSTAADLRAVEGTWWNENTRWTYQDQLSLPVVLWRLGKGCELVQKNLWSNEWFDWIPHRSDA